MINKKFFYIIYTVVKIKLFSKELSPVTSCGLIYTY